MTEARLTKLATHIETNIDNIGVFKSQFSIQSEIVEQMARIEKTSKICEVYA